MIGSDSGRRLPNWIESFTRYSSITQSPEIWRRWTAIGIVSAVMERKIWSFTKGAQLYPNMYTFLVGLPGMGKSQILSLSEKVLRKVPHIHVAPSSVSTASLVDSVALAKRNVIMTGHHDPIIEFNSLQVIASELGVFMPKYEDNFMSMLTKLYDGELYEERRRTGKVNHLLIENTLLSIIGGTTPAYLNSMLPIHAWDQGFTSRAILIYSNEKIIEDIWVKRDSYLTQFFDDLVADLKQISNCYGEMEFSLDCQSAITKWIENGLPPKPEHRKLDNYNSRRLTHCLKLCIISSMARSNDLFVTLDDFRTALGWLLAAEEAMPDIFNAMAVSADAKTMDDLKYFLLKLSKRDGRPVGEHMLYAYLRERVSAKEIEKMITVMINSRDIIPVGINGVRYFRLGNEQDLT